MASGQTEHYGLNQWEARDQVLREEFNADNLKLDAALAGKGNCRIALGSYVGTGTCGQSNPTTLEFDAPPLMVFVVGDRSFFAIQGNPTADVSYASTGNTLSLIWSGNSLSWYVYAEPNAYAQLNIVGNTYYYIALFSQS